MLGAANTQAALQRTIPSAAVAVVSDSRRSVSVAVAVATVAVRVVFIAVVVVVVVVEAEVLGGPCIRILLFSILWGPLIA